MIRLLKRIVAKNATVFCNLAVLVAAIAVNNCKLTFYQSREPEGYEKFAKCCKHISKDRLNN